MTLFFDLDGTLEDSRADMIASTNRVRVSLGLTERDEDELRPSMSRGMNTLYFECFDDWLGDADEDSLEFANVRRRYEHDYLANIVVQTRLYPGVMAMLDALSGRARMGVVTNKPEEHSVALLSRLSIAAYFDVVVGGDTCEEAKPSAIPLRHAARALGATGRVVMIGDSGGDIQMAKNAGAFSIWCAWGYAPAPGKLAPDMVARRPEDVVSLAVAALERM